VIRPVVTASWLAEHRAEVVVADVLCAKSVPANGAPCVNAIGVLVVLPEALVAISATQYLLPAVSPVSVS